MGDSIDEGGKVVKSNLIVPNAYGTLALSRQHIDLQWSSYLLHHQVTDIPRSQGVQVHQCTGTEHLHASGDSKIVQCQRIHGNRRVRESILSCGAEDISSVQVLAGLQELNSVDSLISILALCFVPELEQTLSALVRNVLKPGCTLLFCEHVLSSRDDVAWWRHFRSPVWGLAFDGCKLARSTHLCIESMR